MESREKRKAEDMATRPWTPVIRGRARPSLVGGRARGCVCSARRREKERLRRKIRCGNPGFAVGLRMPQVETRYDTRACVELSRRDYSIVNWSRLPGCQGSVCRLGSQIAS